MNIFRTIDEFKAWRGSVSGKIVGFVPTMGALHQGHSVLIREMRRNCDRAVVSIFVNPAQFGEGEDYDKYPRELERDLETCRLHDVDTVFCPDSREMYPEEQTITVDPGPAGKILCGKDRPGHFRGVLTVVNKLFNIVEPGVAWFGLKDFQQYVLIRMMVRQFDMGIDVRGVETVREKDGLAMSSRNRYLDSAERSRAAGIYRALVETRERYCQGERDSRKLLLYFREKLVDWTKGELIYSSVVDGENLAVKQTVDRGDRLVTAVRVGNTRLIDNIAFS